MTLKQSTLANDIGQLDGQQARFRLSRGLSFYLQASIALFFLAASSAPTALYGTYQRMWGFSPITVTVVFAVYALAVLSTLLIVGSLSDHVGRRPVLLSAIAVQASAALVFTYANGVNALLAARILQGLATGAAAGAVGAGLLDIDRAKGTIANAVAPMTGTATGGLLSGVLVQYFPAPTRLVYLVLFAIFLLQAVGVWLMPEFGKTRPGALAALRPRWRVPASVRRPLLLATPALIAAWALAGFYGSLGPSLLRRMLNSNSLLVGGLAIFVLAAGGALSVLLLHRLQQHVLLALGSASLLLGVGATSLAIQTASAPLFFAGSAVAGMGFGVGFQGAIRSVLAHAAAHERAGVLSVLYVISYLAMGVPAVAAGILVAFTHGDLLGTAREYGLAVMALSSLALLGTAWRGVTVRMARTESTF